MALTPSQYLNNSSDVILRDQQHAARLFVDDQFRLAPKFNFLFHVAFKINQAALANINLAQRHATEINMLVKSCDLPSFQVRTETLNQYNRKKNTQFTHTYQPINITFHDDNMGLINQLWQNYYTYYYADPISARQPGSYNRTATKNYNYIKTPYGLDNGSNLPFFKYIKLYQMARHEYIEYHLHNPIITSWNHQKVSYADSGVHENTMQISYEAVSYNSGSVSSGSPEGFAVDHYDKTPSPLTGVGPNTASPTFVNNIGIDPVAFLNNATTTINTYTNTKSLNINGIPNLLTNITNVPGISGVPGILFPVIEQSVSATTAKPVNL